MNSHLKDFAVLVTCFCSNLDKHPLCFFAVCVLVQLDIMENPLFKSEYDVIYPYLPKPPADFAPPQHLDSSHETIHNDSSDDNGDSSNDELDLGALFSELNINDR